MKDPRAKPIDWPAVRQAVAEVGEHSRRLAASTVVIGATMGGRRTQVVTGHDGVSRVRILR